MRTKIILITAALAACLTSCVRQTDKQKDFAIAEKAVSQMLLAPSTAKFCPIEEAWFGQSRGVGSIELWVDAQNGFGVPIRKHWGVKMDTKTGAVRNVECFEDEHEELERSTQEQLAKIKAIGDDALRTIEHR